MMKTATSTRLNFSRSPMCFLPFGMSLRALRGICCHKMRGPHKGFPRLQMATGSHHGSAPAQNLRGKEWRVLRLLAPYVLEFKWRVAAALACLIAAKLANVGVPLVMKEV